MAEDLGKLKDLHDKLAKQGGGYNFWIPVEGSNLIRILPGVKGKSFYIEAFYHRKITDTQSNMLCPKLTFGQACPICELMEGLQKSGKESDSSTVDMLRPYRRYFMNIVDVGKGSKEVQIYGAPKTVFRDILSYFIDPDWGDLTDVKAGYDVDVERRGTGLSTEYSVKAKKKSTPIDEEFLTKMKDLEDLLKPKSYEDLIDFISVLDLSGNGSVKQEPAKTEAPKQEPAKTEAPKTETKPKCFGKSYADDDPSCVQCNVAESCKPEKKPEVSEDVSEIRKKMEAKLKELKNRK